jgi:CheY-like chemotaxis protein
VTAVAKPRRVLAVAPDLFFAARIAETARACGVDLATCVPADLASRFAGGGFANLIVDLHAPGALDAVRALRATPDGESVEIVGFYSHVDQALRAAALAAGVTQALPRSAFTARLAALLRGDAAADR